MNVYEEFIEKMKQNNLTKEAVIDVLNLYVNGRNFLQHLEEFKNKEGERREYNGIIYSEEYDPDEEEYFGENKVLFYSGDGEDDYDIVNYDELYHYINAACNFYIEKNPEKKEVIEDLSMKIKAKYAIK
ncbi:ribonuclease toxin immunity protein CdiI [Terribacillus aidingensis]|uniref:ribonuclease toxin immunity protein CdiI n=1 Tax=Terribacillus aidingensis TaxID=586416 RepID=UPI00344B5126